MARGFKTMYIKIGFDLKNDLALARAIREEVGDDIAVRVDANEAWSVFEAIDALQRFEHVGVEFVEQPIDMHDIAGLADLRTKSRVSIGANQSVWQPWQVPEVLGRRAGDVIVTDQHQLGGLVPFHNAAHVRVGERPDHQARVRRPGDHHHRRLPRARHAGVAPARPPAVPDDPRARSTEETIEFVHGAIPVPTGPGLGIELDREAVEFYEEVYERYGEFEGYGPITPESPLPAELHVARR